MTPWLSGPLTSRLVIGDEQKLTPGGDWTRCGSSIYRPLSRKENWAKLSDNLRERLADASKELRERRHDMSEWLGKLQETANSTWDDKKAEFNKAYAKFKDAWDKHDDEAKEAGVEKKSE